MYKHLKDYDSYTRQHHPIEECKDINAKKEYPFIGENIEKHETCNLP
jgi:hypothetical protein